MERLNALNTDTLNLVLDKLLTDNPLHVRRLKYVYSISEQIIKELNWQDFPAIPKPKVLLCGTGSPTTTHEYVKHIRKQNSNTEIQVLDLSAYPLYRSKDKLGQDSLTNYTQADTLRLPFIDNSFDRIETDRLLQFFSLDSKRQVIDEWKRILKPGGIVTTREHLITPGNKRRKSIR